MRSSAELRAAAAQCLKAARDATDPHVSKKMAARAFHLAQQAEAVDRAAMNSPEKADRGRGPG